MTSRARAWLAGFLGFAVLTMIWLTSQAGYYLESAAQTPERAELLVALGGEAGDRSIKTLQLYEAGYAPRILLTGIEDSPFAVRPAYLNWRAQVLIDYGVPRAAILLDTQSSNTMEEAVNTRQLMIERGWQKVLVVTDPPHLRRALWAWHKAFSGTGLEFRIVASNANWWRPGSWWMHEKIAPAVITEYIKLFYYIVTK